MDTPTGISADKIFPRVNCNIKVPRMFIVSLKGMLELAPGHLPPIINSYLCNITISYDTYRHSTKQYFQRKLSFKKK